MRPSCSWALAFGWRCNDRPGWKRRGGDSSRRGLRVSCPPGFHYANCRRRGVGFDALGLHFAQRETTLPNGLPTRHGLYDPSTEHDSCGVGFVVHIRGEKSRSIVEHALDILDHLSHRAACGADPETADGAGILLQLPHRFFKREGLRLGFEMPRRRCYGVGQVFLPHDPAARAACERRLRPRWPSEEDQRVLGWRDVPVDASPARAAGARGACRSSGRSTSPGAAWCPRPSSASSSSSASSWRTASAPSGLDPRAPLPRREPLRRDHRLQGPAAPGAAAAASTWTSRTPDMVSALALVHSRFSHQHVSDLGARAALPLHRPQRRDQHRARQPELAQRAPQPAVSPRSSAAALDRLFPIVLPERVGLGAVRQHARAAGLGGRSLPHAMMLMIPEAWEKRRRRWTTNRRAFYEYSERAPGAVGRTGGHRLHRRLAHRRDARPQRPPPGAVAGAPTTTA